MAGRFPSHQTLVDPNMKIKYNRKALILLPFIAIGPAITVFLIWQGKNYTPTALIAGLALAGVLIVITAIAAFIARRKYPLKEVIKIDIFGISWIITIITAAIFSYRDAFFVVALIFAAICSLPTIYPLSIFWSKFLRPSDDRITNDINKSKATGTRYGSIFSLAPTIKLTMLIQPAPPLRRAKSGA